MSRRISSVDKRGSLRFRRRTIQAQQIKNSPNSRKMSDQLPKTNLTSKSHFNTRDSRNNSFESLPKTQVDQQKRTPGSSIDRHTKRRNTQKHIHFSPSQSPNLSMSQTDNIGVNSLNTSLYKEPCKAYKSQRLDRTVSSPFKNSSPLRETKTSKRPISINNTSVESPRLILTRLTSLNSSPTYNSHLKRKDNDDKIHAKTSRDLSFKPPLPKKENQGSLKILI